MPIALAADQYLEGNRSQIAASICTSRIGSTVRASIAATEILESVAQGALSAGDTEPHLARGPLAANRLEHEGEGHAAVQLLKNTLESCEWTLTRGAQHYESGTS